MGKSSMFVPVAVAVLFILGLLLMFNLTPGARDTAKSPQANGNSVEAGAPLATDPSTGEPITTDPAPGVTDPQSTEPSVTEPTPTEPTLPPDTILPGGKTVTANNSFAYDMNAQRFLYTGGDIHKHIFPASITKLMTSHLLLKYMEPTTVVTVGNEIYTIDPDSSRADLIKGDRISVENLIYAMLLPSGNDAAYTAAAACGRVIAEDPNLDWSAARDVFVREMNAEAKLLGMVDTNFVTPDGNHDWNHHTSMHDLVILSNTVIQNELIMTAVKTPKKDVSHLFGRTMIWYNSNYLIRPERDPYTETAIGLKTGTTMAAGACLLALFRDGDRDLLVGIFASHDNAQRFVDALTIYECYH